MNRFNDENKIISDFQKVKDSSVLFVVESENAEKVYHSIHSLEL